MMRKIIQFAGEVHHSVVIVNIHNLKFQQMFATGFYHVSYEKHPSFRVNTICILRATCCTGHLYLCKIEKIDFLKIGQEKGFY